MALVAQQRRSGADSCESMPRKAAGSCGVGHCGDRLAIGVAWAGMTTAWQGSAASIISVRQSKAVSATSVEVEVGGGQGLGQKRSKRSSVAVY